MAEGYPIKLVRDRVVSIDTSEGLRYRSVRDRNEHVRRLRAKLVEEVGEYLIDPSIGELADIVECVRGLAFIDLRVGVVDVEAECERKRLERGGFETGVVMETIETELGR